MSVAPEISGHTGGTEDDSPPEERCKSDTWSNCLPGKSKLEQGKMILTPDETAQEEPDQKEQHTLEIQTHSQLAS
jgi:hypothetical protein